MILATLGHVIVLAQLASADSKVTVGSPLADFGRNVQNEPALAFDPMNPLVLAAGANDGIDRIPCNGSHCSGPNSVGGQGIYFSFDGGATWIQPEYTGWSARTGTAGPGPIGTVPNFYENGMASGSDPAVAFGPRPGPGGFSWANGSRLYFGCIANGFPGATPPFPGISAITVSHADDLVRAAAGDNGAWSAPVPVTRQNPTTASDKEALWADNVASSPSFGNVYECDDGMLSNNPKATPQPIMFSRSTDGGVTWDQRQISSAADPIYHNARFGGRSGCTIRTDSAGTVYVFWAGYTESQDLIYMARSSDGGATFEHGKPILSMVTCGAPDAVAGFPTIDGLGGSRINSFASVDIASGAPTGAGATDEIVLTQCDASAGLGNERALVYTSADGGTTWSAPVVASAAGERPAFPAVAIAPGGTDVYVTYDAFFAPWQPDTSSPRWVQGVVRHALAASGGLGAFSDLHRGVLGDARGTSRATLSREFIYDYNSIAATASGVYALWMDARNALDCPAVDSYRLSLATETPVSPPAPATDCPAGFGNLDIYAGYYTP
jgi:hypothetical protein